MSKGDHVVFIDAANKGLCSTAGIVITNSEGMVVEVFSVRFEAKFPLKAESWALFHHCRIHDWSNVNFVSDCQISVLGIKSHKVPDWTTAAVFGHMLTGLDHLPELAITWIPRSRNEMAHRLSCLVFSMLRS
uniref:RNase H type-1 domain-containing protein n=1 Tax=Cannabis sativa TaxID=3483 RepID=A0A803NS54_CANSA